MYEQREGDNEIASPAKGWKRHGGKTSDCGDARLENKRNDGDPGTKNWPKKAGKKRNPSAAFISAAQCVSAAVEPFSFPQETAEHGTVRRSGRRRIPPAKVGGWAGKTRRRRKLTADAFPDNERKNWRRVIVVHANKSYARYVPSWLCRRKQWGDVGLSSDGHLRVLRGTTMLRYYNSRLRRFIVQLGFNAALCRRSRGAR